jgi:hypothetical protein
VCEEVLRQQLFVHPGSTWAAYSARRLLTRTCETHVALELRSVTRDCEPEPEAWAAAVQRQAGVREEVREQAARAEALARIQKRAAAKRAAGADDDDDDDDENDEVAKAVFFSLFFKTTLHLCRCFICSLKDRRKRRNIEYKCTRDECTSVFKKRQHRDEHYRIVHNYIPALHCSCGIDDKSQARAHDEDCPAHKKVALIC